MENIYSHILIAITTFAITNIDDLLLLSIYFAHPEQYKPKHIVIGQYSGVFFLVGISLTGVILGEIINKESIRFLGLIPIYLGFKDLYLFLKAKRSPESESVDLKNGPSFTFWKITLVTIANGGDNIGVYTPLFAITPSYYIYLYLILFSLLIGIWCLLGKYLVSHERVKIIFAKYGRILLPVFLILLGFFIIF